MKSLIVGRVGADLGAAVVLLLFCAWAYYVTTTFDPPVLRGYPGAAFFPQLILVVLLLLALVLLGRSVMAWRTGPVTGDGAAGEYRFEIGPFLLIVGAVFLLISGISLVGFEIAAVLFLTVLLGLRSGRWLQALLAGMLSTGVMYLLFVQLLRVHLPLMLLPRYL